MAAVFQSHCLRQRQTLTVKPTRSTWSSVDWTKCVNCAKTWRNYEPLLQTNLPRTWVADSRVILSELSQLVSSALSFQNDLLCDCFNTRVFWYAVLDFNQKPAL